VLPGSFLAREAKGINPGAGYVRIALVAGQAECEEAARRMVAFVTTQADRLAPQTSDQH
jgi:N-succinyldiaminopimelate aminotransferase